MFAHIYINRLKCLIRDRQLVFWTLLYPLVLALLFHLAFSNIGAATSFSRIPVDVVQNSALEQSAGFKEAITQASGGSGPLFTVSYVSQEQADADLKDNKITGYVRMDNGAQVVVKDNGFNQTILKQFVDAYLQYGSAYMKAMQQNPQNAASLSIGQKNFMKETYPGKERPDTFVIYYYALLGMAAMFGGFWGVKEIEDIQANLSARGARLNIAPVHKLKAFGASLPAAVTVQFGAMLVLLAFLKLALGIDFGGRMLFIILTCLAGSIAGVTYGAMIGSLFKNGHLRMALLITISLAFSFLAGMMVPGIRYTVAQAVPWLSYINPSYLISDAFYALYYYTGYDKFIISVALLLALSAVFCLVVYFKMRRQRYASL